MDKFMNWVSEKYKMGDKSARDVVSRLNIGGNMEFGRIEDYVVYRSLDVNDDNGELLGCIELDADEIGIAFIAAERGAFHAFTINEMSAILDRMHKFRASGR